LVTEKPVFCVASHSHFDHVGSNHEFDERLMHAAEADILTTPTRDNTVTSNYVTADIFTAAPYAGFDVDAYEIKAAPPTRLVADGDIIDLGDRHFEVLHLPGHSPGSIALWEAATGTLLSGDVIYDGLLYDELYHSVREDYTVSMERLRDYKVKTVHGGHWESFGQARLIELIDEYLAGARKPGCPND
jgi:glyoxylase-like metal-dependent hydrolase (beta-lactamase superfamily II)